MSGIGAGPTGDRSATGSIDGVTEPRGWLSTLLEHSQMATPLPVGEC